MQPDAHLSILPRNAKTSLRPEDFQRLALLVAEESGLNLRAAKQNMIISRLSPRLSRIGVSDFQAYCDHVESDAGISERRHMIELLTTNVTKFFRERHHFEALRQTVLPPLIAAAKAGKAVRIWSAGCSTGQEAFSIAMLVLHLCPKAVDLDLKILATDLNTTCLSTAQRGILPVDPDNALMPEYMKQFSRMVHSRNALQIRADVQKLITFAELNLIKPWPMQGLFDIIFCRNVVIYFGPQTQETLWRRFAEALVTGGHLFIGHSERVHGAAEAQFIPVGTTQYRRV